MKHRGPSTPVSFVTAPLALVLVLPAAALYVTSLLRDAQPIQHQPAAVADVIFTALASLPRPFDIVIYLVCPLLAGILAASDQLEWWARDAAWRSAVTALVGAGKRALGRPLAVLSALALLSSVLWLTFVIVHAFTG